MIRYDPQWSQFNPVTCGCYNQAADDTDRVRRPRSKHSFRSKPRLITASRPPGASDTNRSRARRERERVAFAQPVLHVLLCPPATVLTSPSPPALWSVDPLLNGPTAWPGASLEPSQFSVHAAAARTRAVLPLLLYRGQRISEQEPNVLRGVSVTSSMTRGTEMMPSKMGGLPKPVFSSPLFLLLFHLSPTRRPPRRRAGRLLRGEIRTG